MGKRKLWKSGLDTSVFTFLPGPSWDGCGELLENIKIINSVSKNMIYCLLYPNYQNYNNAF